MSKKQPMLLIFAGPNGSGKSTITELIDIIGTYVNADDIQREEGINNIDAAIRATAIREELLRNKSDLTYETVFSTSRHIEFISKAKNLGYFIKCFYVLTKDVEINIQRVKSRVISGGHSVDEDKIRKRYPLCMDMIPDIIKLCDIVHIYDNSGKSFSRIYKKRKTEEFIWSNEFWTIEEISALVHKHR